MTPAPCPVCGVVFQPDPTPLVRCIAQHPLGECCHVGELIVAQDGRLVSPTRRRTCTLQSLACPCGGTLHLRTPDDFTRVLQCQECGDAVVERCP